MVPFFVTYTWFGFVGTCTTSSFWFRNSSERHNFTVNDETKRRRRGRTREKMQVCTQNTGWKILGRTIGINRQLVCLRYLCSKYIKIISCVILVLSTRSWRLRRKKNHFLFSANFMSLNVSVFSYFIVECSVPCPRFVVQFLFSVVRRDEGLLSHHFPHENPTNCTHSMEIDLTFKKTYEENQTNL